MPNHCWNTLIVIGYERDLDVLEQTEFKFAALLPIPDNLDNENDERHEWCVGNWGTKWERWDYDKSYRCKYEISVTFDTAWNPPFAYLRHVLERFPRCWLKLTFATEANEAGVWIAYKWKNELVEKKMFWNEPMAALNYNAEIVIPHSAADDAV